MKKPLVHLIPEKERQLREGEHAIAVASTPDAVAGAFAVAVTPVLADIDIDAPHCSYSSGRRHIRREQDGHGDDRQKSACDAQRRPCG